ncbi:tektin-4 [Agrilus planipennis]|uniref:Tektin n=1 Tax=Agrilus planipennis TaxID=224129 RepID=A0A7F5R9Z9_AGRPL|nr:tektin-4 [Agrilus planipennis]
MAEYPPRGCGPCPYKAGFQKGKDSGDYLEANTVPKPEVLYQSHTKLNDQKLGVPTADVAPDLKKPPTEGTGNEPQRDQRELKECKNCALGEPSSAPKAPEPQAEGAKQPLKGILKKETPQKPEMSASEGKGESSPPSESQQQPENSTEPCYFPQPQDKVPDQSVKEEMGPVGPWATGRVDWGPMAGFTGTRPVVDRYSITRYSEGEWRAHNQDMLNMSALEQHKANLIDFDGRKCLEEKKANVDKNQEDSTNRLRQRLQEMQRWKCELESSIAAAAEEISLLDEERARLKKAKAILQMPISIASECLDIRTTRLDSELVRDEVEVELMKELALTVEIEETFTRTLKDIEHQLLEDKTAKNRLECDWTDKKEANELEAINIALNNKSNILMFKAGSTRFPEEQSSRESWEKFTKETLVEAEATRQRSITLRGTLDAILINAARDLRAQADKVEMCLSKRIDCIDNLRVQLEDELKKILQKLANVEGLVNDLRALVRRMDVPMKKAQTRLDNRNHRPRVENCRDEAQFGLVAEVKSIGENVSAILGQLRTAEESQASLIKARSDLEREIMLKRKTLEIDRTRIQTIRSFYPSATALMGN